MERIKLWWKFEGRYYHKDFANGIKNLWRWFPTVWKDRDWDASFIYQILAKKLEFQADYIGRRDFHVDSKRDAERMMLVVRLIRFQQEEKYTNEYMDYHDSKIDFVPTDSTQMWYEMIDTQMSERFDEFFKKYPRQYRRALSGEVSRFRRSENPIENKKLIAMEIAHENQERSRELLFKIMSDHIERWWD
jgi:hypothetical protein